MVVVAECFLQYHESNALSLVLNNNIHVKSFKRYVNDIHSRFQVEEDVQKFLDLLNKQHKNIQYTIESADLTNTLNYLDVSVTNNKTGTYSFKIHRKNAITNVQIKPNSCHDPKFINDVFIGFVHRALRLCTINNIDDELSFLIDSSKRIVSLPWIPGISTKLRRAFKKAGYAPVFKSPKNLQSLLSSKNKPTLPVNSFPGVYKLKCSCGKCYVGKTGLKISSRICQHQTSAQQGKGENSAVAEHSKICQGKFNWNGRNTLKIETNSFNRKVREALEIQLNESTFRDNGLNRDDGDYVTTSFWKPMFKFLSHKKLTKITLKKKLLKRTLFR
nr:uncharacterized protein LOC124819034 [Hydra vulgaris]